MPQLLGWYTTLTSALAMADEDFLDEGDGLSDTPDFPLPEGVTKEILTEAKTSEWRKPKHGDEAT